MKIVLLGYMGSGKSAVGKELAIELGLSFYDLDEWIEEGEGKTISEIFKDNGEIYFRKKESEYLKTILDEKMNCILAVGGGTPCYGSNMDFILNSSISIYLQASITTLVARLIGEMNKRPLVASLGSEELNSFIAKHLFERRAFYERADHSIAVNDKTIEELVIEIEKLLQ